MDDVAKVLNDAADLIEPEGRWTRGAYARDVNGEIAIPVSPQACSWCAMGAIRHVAPDERLYALPVLRRYLGDEDIDLTRWNDAQPTVQYVVAALQAAARSVDTTA
jgi:hypothetical protein